MATCVYDCLDDAAAWTACLPFEADIFHTPQWVALLDQRSQARGLLFRYASDAGQWIYPFIMRPVPPSVATGVHDIESAYGYGGPLSSTDDPKFLTAARSAFDQWCADHQILAEFTTFHPLIRNEKWMVGAGMRILKDRDTASIDLNAFDGESFAFAPNARGSIAKGKSQGVRARVLEVDEHFAGFVTFYLTAMKAMGSTDFYLFDDTYFERLKALVLESGWLIAAEVGGRWAAVSIFLRRGPFIHYHLSAQDRAVKAAGASGIIIDASARLGAARGLTHLHMGGGRTNAADDSLFKFKRSMSTRTDSFHFGKKIHLLEIYQGIQSRWRSEFPEASSEKLLFYR